MRVRAAAFARRGTPRRRSWLVAILGVGCALAVSGCISTLRHPGVRTRAALYDAWLAWENGRTSEALAAAQRAVRFAARERLPDEVLVEVYDDAGLYYHASGLHDQAVFHQAIAVLLARKSGLPPERIALYEGRLRQAMAAAHPDFVQDAQATSTSNLLKLKNIRENPHIRYAFGPGE